MSKDFKILTFINLYSLLCFVLNIILPCIAISIRQESEN